MFDHVKQSRDTEDHVENANAAFYQLDLGLMMTEIVAKRLGVVPGPTLAGKSVHRLFVF